MRNVVLDALLRKRKLQNFLSVWEPRVIAAKQEVEKCTGIIDYFHESHKIDFTLPVNKCVKDGEISSRLKTCVSNELGIQIDDSLSLGEFIKMAKEKKCTREEWLKTPNMGRTTADELFGLFILIE